MTEYSYKNFKLHYDIQDNKSNKNLYTADGYISNVYDKDCSCTARKFHTEFYTKSGVRSAIKQLMENYIDFEWREYYEIHGKNASVKRSPL